MPVWGRSRRLGRHKLPICSRSPHANVQYLCYGFTAKPAAAAKRRCFSSKVRNSLAARCSAVATWRRICLTRAKLSGGGLPIIRLHSLPEYAPLNGSQ